ncbi:putative NAD dependent epimerase/dehydratase [Viridothelium virens]|uniref:Putative NAD dependent epimerase/dehydratase n=1 Tax=Viridothelium virens TaxID=1048519 RepID=A0A6A6H0U2_VIRVR|nr:putative NAD dependent epimerase/dehydratase [Viridothelium virens]
MSNPTPTNKGRLFITGATGYIGRVVTELALSSGWATVHGLSRTPTGDTILSNLGATPIRGELSSLDVLQRESAAADAVLHLAFIHDFSGATPYSDILATDAAAVDAMATGLRGTGKPLVISSGCALVEADPAGAETDETAAIMANPPLERMKAEAYALRLKEEGVRVSAIRLAPFVYGRGGSGFLPMLLQQAALLGESVYVEDGATRSTDVHVDDAARMYLLAVEKAKPGDVFNCTSSTNVTSKELAGAIGEVIKVPVRSVSREEAVKKLGPFLPMILTHENRSASRKAMGQLGWQPKEVDRLTDTTRGSYVAFAEKLRSDASQKTAGL